MPAQNTIRVHVPLTLRKRGGRPRILPPKEIEAASPAGQDPRLLRAIGRAWRWRKMLETGEVATLTDLAAEEGLSDRYLSRLTRLAWRASPGWHPRCSNASSSTANPAPSPSTSSA
jgi:hypothetical protein